MARKGEKPDYSTSSLQKPVSSEDLLKEAWESMGRLDTGERTGDSSTSRSAEMTSAANLSSTASSEQRASAEEIARLLAKETDRRAAERRPQPAPPQRRPTAEPRQRRTQPLQAPERQAPAPQPVPTQQQPPRGDGGRPRQGRRGLGWLIFGAIWLIGAFVGLFTEDTSTSPPDISIDVPDLSIDFSDLTSTTLDPSIDSTNVTLLNIRDLEPGTCVVTLPFGEVIDDVATVPCSDPHQYELFANAQLVGNDYPGDDIFSEAFEACGTQFFDYVGEAYATSEWYVDVITPTEQGWNQAGDREVNCLLYLFDDDAEDVSYVTGSAQGTGDAG
jgi:hypothetical protein